MNLKTNKKIPYNMHESEFIDCKIEKNNLIFRVAINCALVEKLGIECEYGEKYYLYDIICHNYQMIETNYDANIDLSNDILDFFVSGDKYIFAVNLDFEYRELYDRDEIDFVFDCEYLEWVPLKLISGDYLFSEEIENWRFNK